jgi:high-affinity nickel-transport protein
VTSTAIGVVLGLLVGLRHSFEPDHLTAVSTLVGEARGARSGALLGAVWGIGHTIALVAVGTVLMVIGATLPARAAAVFELGVAAMLLVLGARAIVAAVRTGAEHHHVHTEDSAQPAPHAGPPHIHVGVRTLAWRPLVVGLVHGLAGSGALTAIVFADLPGAGARLLYMTLFGLGSIAGMALASGAAGATLGVVARSGAARRGLGVVTGLLSIAVGVLWAIPMWSQLASG